MFKEPKAAEARTQVHADINQTNANPETKTWTHGPYEHERRISLSSLTAKQTIGAEDPPFFLGRGWGGGKEERSASKKSGYVMIVLTSCLAIFLLEVEK